MNKHLWNLTSIMILLSFASTNCAHGDMTLFFSGSSSNPTTPDNPTISIQEGGTSTLYLWADLADGDAINGLAFDIDVTTAGVVAATSHDIENSPLSAPFAARTRWAGTAAGTNGELIGGANLVGGLDSTSTGLDVSFRDFDGAAFPTIGDGAQFLVSAIDLVATGAAGTSTQVFLEVGMNGISYSSGGASGNVFLGIGDAGVPGNPLLGGPTMSTLADATISVVPEPSMIPLFGLATAGVFGFRWWKSRKDVAVTTA